MKTFFMKVFRGSIFKELIFHLTWLLKEKSLLSLLYFTNEKREIVDWANYMFGGEHETPEWHLIK